MKSNKSQALWIITVPVLEGHLKMAISNQRSWKGRTRESLGLILAMAVNTLNFPAGQCFLFVEWHWENYFTFLSPVFSCVKWEQSYPLHRVLRRLKKRKYFQHTDDSLTFAPSSLCSYSTLRSGSLCLERCGHLPKVAQRQGMRKPTLDLQSFVQHLLLLFDVVISSAEESQLNLLKVAEV